LVSDLLDLWNGVHITISGKTKYVRAALLGVCCDLPAGWKV